MAFKTFVAASSLLLVLASAAPQGDGSCTICIDKVNDCQNMYGACYDYCVETKKEFLVPECNGFPAYNETCEYGPNNNGLLAGECYPSNTTTVPGPVQDCMVCVDRVNECGLKYGACYDYCQMPQFDLGIPACNGVSGQKVSCEFKKNKDGKLIGGCHPSNTTQPTPPGETCDICIDRVNDCGQMYGGCYNFCNEPRKEFEVPECNGQKKTEICEYMSNDCGKVFGGCYPPEGPIPGWAEPPCP